MEEQTKQNTPVEAKMEDWTLESSESDSSDPNLNICESCQ